MPPKPPPPPPPPSKRPPQAPPLSEAPLPMSDKDSVSISIKTTYRTAGDVFVSSEVGYTGHALEKDAGDLRALYSRVRSRVNAMFAARDAEVRASLGIK